MQRRNSDSTQNVFGEDNESKSQASSLDSEEPAKGRFMVSWNRRNCNVIQKNSSDLHWGKIALGMEVCDD